ncbi:hypothetical protein BJX76DRAFT_212010 [Aspergillus varians]
MTDACTLQRSDIFSPATKTSFLQHLTEHPSSRRLSQREKENVIQWLTDPSKKPSSQSEFSRRNYARKAFFWDSEQGILLAVNKDDRNNNRIAVTEDMIPDIVEAVHNGNGHAGWDGTWKDISNSYHGILRSDVIYLLKRCRICMCNPAKRPKKPERHVAQFEFEDSEVVDSLDLRELECSISSPNIATQGDPGESEW